MQLASPGAVSGRRGHDERLHRLRMKRVDLRIEDLWRFQPLPWVLRDDPLLVGHLQDAGADVPGVAKVDGAMTADRSLIHFIPSARWIRPISRFPNVG